MGQTLLAIVAILVFSLFALNQHRAQASAERNAVSSELEFTAADLARRHLADATALPFDEALLGVSTLLVDPTILTLPSAFGPGRDPGDLPGAPPDDVDDLHRVVDTLQVMRDGQTGRTTPFVVSRFVRYVLVNAPGTPASGNTRTLAKEVSVTVTEVAAPGGERPAAVATITQVVTPAWHAIHG